MRYVYPFDITGCEEDGEGFVVTFPDVPEAITGGFTRSKAMTMAEDCLTVALGGYVQMGWDLPAPSPVAEGQELVAVPPLAAAKLALYTAMRQQGISQDFLAEKLGLTSATVKRLLEPDRHSPWSQVTRALALVGRKLVVEDRAA
jgi:antitoxin HicB